MRMQFHVGFSFLLQLQLNDFEFRPCRLRFLHPQSASLVMRKRRVPYPLWAGSSGDFVYRVPAVNSRVTHLSSRLLEEVGQRMQSQIIVT